MKSALDRRYDEKMREVKAINDRIEVQRVILEKSNKESDSLRSGLPKLRADLDEKKKGINERYDQKKQLNAEFKQQEDEFYAKLKEDKKKEEEEMKKAREQRKVILHMNGYFFLSFHLMSVLSN